MPKRNRQTKQQAEDDRLAAAVSPTAFVRRDKGGNFIDIIDYGEFAGVGSADLDVGKPHPKIVDPTAFVLALDSEPLRSLPGSADLLRIAREGGDWFKAVNAFMRQNRLSELPGVGIDYK